MSFEVESEEVDWTLRSLLVQLVAMGTQDGMTLREGGVEGNEGEMKVYGRQCVGETTCI